MLQKLKTRNQGQRGFTIIEVLIVLAIAGLIMLIVFLAVPSLQRASRNTSRKNDISAISSAVSNFMDNNGGVIPNAIWKINADTTSLAVGCDGATIANFTLGNNDGSANGRSYGCPSAAPFNDNYETAKLGYYSAANIYVNDITTLGAGGVTLVATGSATSSAVATNTAILVLGEGCNTTNTGLSGVANTRTAALIYATESSSGNGSMQCLEQ